MEESSIFRELVLTHNQLSSKGGGGGEVTEATAYSEKQIGFLAPYHLQS